MQERYLGDSHDFIKYGLLLHLHGALSVLKPSCRFVLIRIGLDFGKNGQSPIPQSWIRSDKKRPFET
jgi:hypothetical protein